MSPATEQLFLLLLGAALASSAITLVVLFLVFHFWLGPRLERRLDERMERVAADMEAHIKARITELLGGPREVFQQRARDLARTGMGILAPRRTPGQPPDDEEMP